MSDYKRLTKQAGWHKDIDLKDELGYSYIYQRLSELENKIEQGTLVELPCKVGDTIYVPWVYDGEYGVSFHEIKRIEIYKGGIDILFDVYEGNVDIDALYAVLYIYNAGRFNLSLLGERFFITREEAEKRLKELQNGRN